MPYGGPHTKDHSTLRFTLRDYSTLGSILGSPYSGILLVVSW